MVDGSRILYEKNRRIFDGKTSENQNEWAKSLIEPEDELNRLGQPLRFINAGRLAHYSREKFVQELLEQTE